MKCLAIAISLAATILCACAPAVRTTVQAAPGWTLYRNSKYGYEIQYPEGYDLWETGPENARDGASIRIGLKEYQALAPMLYVQIEPRSEAADFPNLPASSADLRIEMSDVAVNGVAAKQAAYYWTQNGNLAFVQINMQGVLFRFSAGPGASRFHNTPWWAIISTFRVTAG